MNKLMKEQIRKDFIEILSSDAGLRVFGSIFAAARINDVQQMNEFFSGRRSMGLSIANTIREINPHAIAECEIAYEDFEKEYRDERGYEDNGGD